MVSRWLWWFAMNNAGVSSILTPRPTYHADGRKSPGFYGWPGELQEDVRRQIGEFPLFHFWGPGADIRSTRWIGRAAEHVLRTRRPGMTFVYLPHLDYDLQRFGSSLDGIDGVLARSTRSREA